MKHHIIHDSHFKRPKVDDRNYKPTLDLINSNSEEQPVDVVICVDGTDSINYKNRSVENFYNQVRTEHKVYHPGPNDIVFGSDWIEIRDSVIRESKEIAKKFGEETFFNGYQSTIGRRKDLRFIMIGHSRGGHIIIHLARMLKYRVAYMGLYDAVQFLRRSDAVNNSVVQKFPWLDDIDNSKVIYNTDSIYHARRHPDVGSRGFFGSTGLINGDGGSPPYEKYFKTSHGGIGGDVRRYLDNDWTADDSCAVDRNTEKDLKTDANIGDVQDLLHQLELRRKWEKMRTCVDESHLADQFIKQGAILAGVKGLT